MWLKYKRAGASPEVEARRFNELDIRERETTRRDTGETLRSIEFDYLLSDRRTYDVFIGADELVDPDAKAFVGRFWTSHERWIYTSDPTAEPEAEDFVAVTLPEGDNPLEYLDDDSDFPTITITVRERYPR